MASGLDALAQIDLADGEMAMLSGGALYVYDARDPEHRCGPEDCDHASGCAVHNEPAYPAGPCNCEAL